MRNAPRVSVVIATYNRADFLTETIDSILNQSFQDFELLVVDDGSTDHTGALLASYGPRIRTFYQANRGPSAARNMGVSHAVAPWISIQDSDDVCAADHLAILYDHVLKRPDCGMVFANGAYLGGPQHNRDTIIPKIKSRRLARDGVRLTDIFEKSIVRLQAALISKSRYDEVGGHDESLRISMDLDLAFRIIARCPVAYLDKIVFYYRKHDGNIGRNQELRLLENIRVIEKLLDDYPAAKALLGRRRIASRLAYRYYRLAKGRWKAGNRIEAREAIRKAAELRPFSFKYGFFQRRWS